MAKSRLPVEKVSGTVLAERSEHEKSERKYRAEEALRNIERAEEHRRDKSLMKDVKGLIKSKMKAYGKL